MATSKKVTKKTETKKVAAPKKVATTHKANSEETLTPQQEQQGVEAANPDAGKDVTTLPQESEPSVSDVLKKNRT